MRAQPEVDETRPCRPSETHEQMPDLDLMLVLSDEALAAIELLSRKWVLRIVEALQGAPMRQFQLRAALSKIQPRVLRETLRIMEEGRLIERQFVDGDLGGTSVLYCLSDAGRRLPALIRAIAEWTDLHGRPRAALQRTSRCRSSR